MKKKNHIKMRFSTILLCIPAILLCTAAYGGTVLGINYDDGDVHNVTEDLVNEARAEEGLGEGGLDWLHVGADTTVNLYADVSQYVYAFPGSVLNIHSGNVALYIMVWQDAKVTVYGTNFAVKEGGHLNPSATQFTVDGGALGGVLTGTYGNDGPIDIELRFISSVAIQLSPPLSSEVEIDIKPGGNPNNINLSSKGVVPVAVLTTDSLDASTIDPDTVEFAGAKPVRWKLEDVDGDGDDDMLFHFKTQELNLDKDSIEATLTGKTFDGIEIGGTDAVRIVQKKK